MSERTKEHDLLSTQSGCSKLRHLLFAICRGSMRTRINPPEYGKIVSGSTGEAVVRMPVELLLGLHFVVIENKGARTSRAGVYRWPISEDYLTVYQKDNGDFKSGMGGRKSWVEIYVAENNRYIRSNRGEQQKWV